MTEGNPYDGIDTSVLKNKVVAGQKDELINAIKQKFATSYNTVHIGSIGEDVGFREIMGIEQKNLSRIMNENKNRKDIVYDAQCAIINQVCLNEGFDVYNVSELDRIKIYLHLYQSNVTKNDIKFTCEECGAENSYKLDFRSVLERLDEFDQSPSVHEYEDNHAKYEFQVQFPMVKRLSDFYKELMKKFPRNRKVSDADDEQMNISYLLQFIKSMKFTMKSDGSSTDVNFWIRNPLEVVDILEAFPQDVIYSDNGILPFITKTTLGKVDDSFEKHKCLNCGHFQANANVQNVNGFFS